MRIVINHLTRMQAGYICVAGIDIRNNAHIRPVLHGRLSATLLSAQGGPFAMAAVVDLGKTVSQGSPPEVEDYYFDDTKAIREEIMKGPEFWQLLKSVSAKKLRTIFGGDLTKKYAGSAVVLPDKGKASLGCLYPCNIESLYVEEDIYSSGKPKKKIRLSLGDPDLNSLDLSVTDIRFYQKDHVTPNENAVAEVNERISRGIEVILSVGLTRAFPQSDPVHWLQINNIHLKDDPAWNL